ncbi:ABC transporter permease [Streptomyces sp. BE133]|uniref:ABC transporter permease n=1 Tax=Streptomyces sp. BE133 TaxID=3002523 RepID=UPI002E790548|nr:ABC transporter permease [Streptomyces sp. BE133]MEE1807402.1 ABC transporter permease [Streptomyces sp. BE133]
MSAPDLEPVTPRGEHARPPARGDRWAAFKASPYLPALVLLFIIAAAAGLFAGSYTYAMANPTPRNIPAAVVGHLDTPRDKVFLDRLEGALDTSLVLHEYATEARARIALEEQKIFAVLRSENGGVGLDVASASGASVAQLLAESTLKVGQATHVPVKVTDVKPLQRGDPRGLALFYISLAAVIVGFVGAIQLSVHAKALEPLERVAFTVAYALLGGFSIAAVVDWLLGSVDLPFVQSWFILAFTMFTTGMVFTMFNALIGRWAMIPTWGLMVMLGNPSSGGAVSWPLLPSVLGFIGRWLPPGASVNAQHAAVYYQGHQRVFPYLVLTGWALVSCAVFWVWRHRHPGGRDHMPQHAATAT